MNRLFTTYRADADLAKIEDFSKEKWGKFVADKYIDSIDQAFERLIEHPGLLREKSEVSGCLKFYRVREHFLVCDVIDQDIYVLAVTYGGMDLPERIGELEPTLIKEANFLHEKIAKSK